MNNFVEENDDSIIYNKIINRYISSKYDFLCTSNNVSENNNLIISYRSHTLYNNLYLFYVSDSLVTYLYFFYNKKYFIVLNNIEYAVYFICGDYSTDEDELSYTCTFLFKNNETSSFSYDDSVHYSIYEFLNLKNEAVTDFFFRESLIDAYSILLKEELDKYYFENSKYLKSILPILKNNKRIFFNQKREFHFSKFLFGKRISLLNLNGTYSILSGVYLIYHTKRFFSINNTFHKNNYSIKKELFFSIDNICYLNFFDSHYTTIDNYLNDFFKKFIVWYNDYYGDNVFISLENHLFYLIYSKKSTKLVDFLKIIFIKKNTLSYADTSIDFYSVYYLTSLSICPVSDFDYNIDCHVSIIYSDQFTHEELHILFLYFNKNGFFHNNEQLSLSEEIILRNNILNSFPDLIKTGLFLFK